MGQRNRTSIIRTCFMLSDIFFWFASIILAAWLRYEFSVESLNLKHLLALGLFAACAQTLLGYISRVYRGRHPVGSFEEARTVAYLVAAVGAITSGVAMFVGGAWEIPRTTAVIATPFVLFFILGVRYMYRIFLERRVAPKSGAEPTLIFGAGYLGDAIIRRMQTDAQSTFTPVALLDDDRQLANRQIRGVKVRGGLQQLPQVAAATGATNVVVAIARADAQLVRRISDLASQLGVTVHVLPAFDQVLQGHTQLSDLREISIEDLIGRRPVDTEVESIAGYLTGKRVLVTGAGGSIGAELCNQILKFGPAELIMVDRDETGLQQAQLKTAGHGLLHTKDVVLADIREPEVLDKIFAQRRPQVVYHAAALKHVPMLEQYPVEAWKTNVLGTLNVLNAAQRVGVETFINISTDKAANPTSVLGHSKRVAEKLTGWMGEQTGKPYLSVRFGNVIGSRGSMLPTFRHLIEQGGPLTVTHPEVTRYFMTIPEACQLVVQAGGIGSSGEVLILDMGTPVKILDIAQRMIKMSGRNIDITFTGLREGEKMHEELLGQNEDDHRPYHPKITHAKVGSLAPTHLDQTVWLQRCAKHAPQTGGQRAD